MENILLVCFNFLFYLAVIGPITTFIHELGHALIMLGLTGNKVSITLGGEGKSVLQWNTRRLNITIHIFSGWIGYTSYENNEIVKKSNMFLYYIFGPLFSLTTAIIFLLLQNSISNSVIIYIFKFITMASFIQFLFTIIPMNYNKFLGGKYYNRSDGMKIKELLFSTDQT
ncbi:hypothetical protein [Oceanobacillus bengalensis]|uniref:M50 family peptidase n=1 Tax=Oceanobacillus bengalensis TaxID=1435466 RepID=A0A494YRT6_9BACI|nr:hypothetical protein [Oceanobacillus bengalensis]RKQ12272.1 hypothetical protein D8M05_18795 [Oceanobacillus bengalensis]